MWRLALLDNQYPRALWMLCEPRWRLWADTKKSAPMALWMAYEERWLLRNPAPAPPMLVQFLSTDQLYSGKSKQRTMFSRPLRGDGRDGVPDLVKAPDPILYALLEEASAHVRQKYDDAAADVAARTAAAGAWASRVAALRIAVPTEPDARKILGNFLEYCTGVDKKSRMRSLVGGDANAMMQGQPQMSLDLMRACIGHLDAVARAAAPCMLLEYGLVFESDAEAEAHALAQRLLAFDAAAEAYALALGMPYERLVAETLRAQMPAAIIADDAQGDLANAVYQAFARQAVEGSLHAEKTGHTRVDLVRHIAGNQNLVLPGAHAPLVNTGDDEARLRAQRRVWHLENRPGGREVDAIAEIAGLEEMFGLSERKKPAARRQRTEGVVPPQTAVPSLAAASAISGMLPAEVWYACEDLDYKTVGGAPVYHPGPDERVVLAVRPHCGGNMHGVTRMRDLQYSLDGRGEWQGVVLDPEPIPIQDMGGWHWLREANTRNNVVDENNVPVAAREKLVELTAEEAEVDLVFLFARIGGSPLVAALIAGRLCAAY